MMEENRGHRVSRNRLIICAGLIGVAFAVPLALVIGNRLSDEALAVLAGAGVEQDEADGGVFAVKDLTLIYRVQYL